MADLPTKTSIAEMEKVADIFQKSGLFPNSKSAYQAFVKIKAGEEFGMTPFVAMQSLNIIQGKVELSGDAQARLLKASGKYDYRVIVHTDTKCKIEFYRFGITSKSGEKISDTWHPIGDSEFTMDDAKRAGLTRNDTWIKFPKNMLFYRALTNGVAFHCPDAMAFRVYSEGEIGGEPPKTFATPADNALGVDLDEMVDKITGELIETVEERQEREAKHLSPPKPTFTEKLKAKAQTTTPVEKLAQAIKTRDGWDNEGMAKHPLDDESEVLEVQATNKGDELQFATELAIAQRWIRQIYDEQGKDAFKMAALIKECFGREVVKMADVGAALKELSLGQLVDGVEALKQRRSEKR